MTDFLLVRHGETVWHAENRYAGRSDVGLTDRGVAQARALGSWAADERLDAVLCSPLVRARRTAEPAAAAHGLTSLEDERLVELDFGEGDGLTRQEMQDRFPDRREAFVRDPVTHHLPGGEDPREAAARGNRCLAEAAAERPGGRILVVAHSTLLRLVLCERLGIPLRDYRRVFPVLRNGAVSELRVTGGESALLSLNLPVDRAH